MNIFFAADHHFQHKNILEYSEDRKRFYTLDIMHNEIISKHNSIVKPDDIVYLLGDVAWKANRETRDLVSALNGKKRLVVGNHDNVKFLYPDLVEEVHLWKYFPNYNFIASHVPLNEVDLARTGLNVHGHLHSEKMNSKKYLNVSLEQTNFYPVSMDRVLNYLNDAL